MEGKWLHHLDVEGGTSETKLRIRRSERGTAGEVVA